jgi:hypothetical protein
MTLDEAGELVTFECLPNHCTRQGNCTEGRKPAAENPLCGECEDGLSQWNTTCEACSSVRGDIIFLLLVVCFALVVIFHRLSQSTAGEIKIFMYFTQTSLLLAGSDNGFILRGFEVFNFDIFRAASGAGCIAPVNEQTRMLLGFLPQLVAMAMLALVALALWLVWRRTGRQLLIEAAPAPEAPKDEDDALPAAAAAIAPSMGANGAAAPARERRFLWFPFVRTLIGLWLFTFTATTSAVLSYLNCLDIVWNGERLSLVAAYPAVRCSSFSYKRYLGVAATVFVVDMLLVPLGLLAVLVYGRRKRLLRAPQFERPLGILYSVYDDKFFWYEIFVLARRTALAAVTVFLFRDWVDRYTTTSILCVFFLCVHLVTQPFRDYSTNLAESVSLSFL